MYLLVLMGRYRLYCSSCNTKFDDDFTNLCPRCGGSGPLLRVDYEEKQIKPLNIASFWKFLPWLPCLNWNDNLNSETIVYKSTGLAKELELKNLYVAFNGYWPEKNAKMVTCTFKELEAPPTFQRAKEKCIDNLLIASAGNTANAFIYAAEYFDIWLYVVVPDTCKYRLVLPIQKPDKVTVIAINKGSDYSDSILFANRISKELNLIREGGARNIARRDGMGTVMLESVLHINQIPKHYFQAIGSGTGAIAVMEASKRLITDGRFGGALPKLHLSQNLPFTPIADAWHSGSNEIPQIDETKQREAINKVYAKVLTNRYPPYSVGGGVYDILKLTNGTMYEVSNTEAQSAAKLFEEVEGIDLVPAASIAVGSLIQAVEKNNVQSKDNILINITGGGEKRLWDDYEKNVIKPDLLCDDSIEIEKLRTDLESLHGR